MMESLIAQTRSRSGARRGNKEDASRSTINIKPQPQKTQSFKDAEGKRRQSWLSKQFSRQTTASDYDLDIADCPAAVAAAAYAIQSLDNSKSEDIKGTAYNQNKPFDKTKNKAEDTIPQPESLKSALKSSDETLWSSFKNPDGKSKRTAQNEPSLKKRISFADDDEAVGNKPEKPTPGDLKRPPTFVADKQPSRDYNKKLEAIMPKTDPVTTQPVETKESGRADAWEKEEIANIRERYVKLRSTIDKWEAKKKKKAQLKIERTEAELNKERAKAMKRNRDKIARIEAIARGAREQAYENREKEESKAREKATKIRLTGKIPATCFCF